MKKTITLYVLILMLVFSSLSAMAAPAISYDGTSVIVSGDVSGAEANQLVTVIIVTPDEDGLERDVAKIYEATTSQELEAIIEHSAIVKLDDNAGFADGYKAELSETLESGICTVYISYLGEEELVKVDSFNHISATEISKLVRRFNEEDADYDLLLTEENLNFLANVGVKKEGYLSLDDAARFQAILKGYAPFEEDKPFEGMSATMNFVESFDEALALEELFEAEDTLSVLNLYNTDIWNVAIGEEDDFSKLSSDACSKILEAVKTASHIRATDVEKLFLAKTGYYVFLELCSQRGDVENFLKNYGEQFGLDLALYNDASFDDYDRINILNDIILGKDKAKNPEDIKTVYESAINSVKKAQNSGTGSASTGNSGSSSSSGGGSSLGGGGRVNSKTPAVTVTPKEEKEETKTLPFLDVNSAHWAYSYIGELYTNGIVSGKNATSFDPDSKVTKEEFIKLLVETLDIKTDGSAAEFADVSADAWYAPYVAAAAKAALITGKEDGTIGVGDYLTRQDVAVLVSRAINVAVTGGSVYSDMDDASEYAKDAILEVAAYGLITGYEDGSFKPMNTITRAESCAILCRLLEKKGGLK